MKTNVCSKFTTNKYIELIKRKENSRRHELPGDYVCHKSFGKTLNNKTLGRFSQQIKFFFIFTAKKIGSYYGKVDINFRTFHKRIWCHVLQTRKY